MHALLEVQVHSMLWMQQFHTPALTKFFEVFTFFGGEGYLLLVPLALWCLDYRTGLQIACLMAVTLFTNTTIKNWAQAPRPFQIDPRIVSPGEAGYSFPSGHAMLVVAYWGTLATWFRSGRFSGVAIAVMLLMATSRVYLGVHFPLDVTVGLLLGAFLFFISWSQSESVALWFAAHTLARRVAIAFAAGFALWLFNALFVPDPLHEHLNLGAAGFLAGATAGAALGLQYLSFDGRGAWWKRVLRFVVGMGLSGGLLYGMRTLGVPSGTLGDQLPVLYLAVLGLWLTFAMPWLFERLRLSH